MKRFAFLVAVVCLCIAGPARADTITTFDAGGSFVGGATLTGTLTIDVTTGSVTAVDLVVGAPESLTFSVLVYQYKTFDGYEIIPETATHGYYPNFALVVPTTTLVNYSGGFLASETHPADGFISAIYFSSTRGLGLDQGSLAPAPEPASLTLASVGGVALLGYGWRRRKRTAE